MKITIAILYRILYIYIVNNSLHQQSTSGIPSGVPTTTGNIMNWLVNKQTRLKDKRLVLLSIEIFINEEGFYFPWTDEGFNAAYTFMYKHYDELTDDDDNTIRIVADEGFEWSAPEYIGRSELSQKDYYKWWKFQSGEYNK